ncbi:retrovirus-related Pol polyprotein from transposon TNT 1-94 [Trichonephila clavipes]|nr:retrovirus-related Pol polyprotein from transposon TNT 1-94 [Trichonephila clavipes]
MSQGTGNVSAKTVSTKHCNSINLTITDVSYVPQLRCHLLSVTCLMDKGSKYENLTDKRIKKIRTDNGLEFINEQLDTYLANSGIFHEETIPYNSESNDKAERANRVLLERARPLLYEKIENDNSIDHVIASDRQNPTPEETVHVLSPPGYEKLIGDDKVCKLKKSINGLPQSVRNWYMKIKGELENFGLKQLASDNCFY